MFRKSWDLKKKYAAKFYIFPAKCVVPYGCITADLRSLSAVVAGDASHVDELRMKEELLVERAKQLLDKQSALDALERQLRAKQEALYWRERCLRSEHLTVVTTTGAMATAAMPPLIHIRPGVMGLERRRVTLAYQPDRHVLLQQTHTGSKQVALPLLVCASWLHGPAVEHRSLAGVLSLSCARPVADG